MSTETRNNETFLAAAERLENRSVCNVDYQKHYTCIMATSAYKTFLCRSVKEHGSACQRRFCSVDHNLKLVSYIQCF